MPLLLAATAACRIIDAAARQILLRIRAMPLLLFRRYAFDAAITIRLHVAAAAAADC